MNANNNKSKTVIISVVALVVGIIIGVVGMDSRAKAHDQNAGPSAAASITPAASALSGGPTLTNQNQWDPFQQIQSMQARMNQEFNDMFQQFRAQPQFNVVEGNPNYALSLNVQDRKDHYEVRAYLPDAKASDVHVSLDDGQTLKVDVNTKQSKSSAQKNETSQMAEWGQYEQMIQLPAPVKADQMKIKREGHELLITIPKAA